MLKKRVIDPFKKYIVNVTSNMRVVIQFYIRVKCKNIGCYDKRIKSF